MAVFRPVLLVHGAWHGAWCWAGVQAQLDVLGVPSWAIDLPGHGLSREPLGDLVTDAARVLAALDVLEESTGAEVVLAGHSYGGAVITEAATCRLAGGGTLAHLVYITAAPTNDGESVRSLGLGANTRLADVMQPGDDGTIGVGPPELASEVFYNRCSPQAAAAAFARLSRQATVSVTQPTSGNPRSSIASTYVICTEDQAIHPENQRALATRCDRTLEIAADHSPFMSAPGATAAILADISTT